ncbi:hypothetical protein F4818DRAFT_457840 [Hypoxylon cercidicola]|nr:hypothetical protein F4818DRAFT_457840 [Hypoxylon cercidicola]
MSRIPSQFTSEDDGYPTRNPVISSHAASYGPYPNATSTIAANIPLGNIPYGSFSSSWTNSAETIRNPTAKDNKFKTFRARFRGNDQKPLVDGPLSKWWWWWEILAIILSIACMCTLVTLLTKMDGLPLQSWWLPIEPNSLVAALTTIAKASMLVPAASCIGQLKWRHFMTQPRRLIDLQLFDDASRGPWGSAVLLWSLCFRTRVLVTFGFALITIIALGIDTSAQQVLTFPLRETQLNNVSVELGTADTYNSKGFLDDTDYGGPIWVPNSDLLALQASIINGATGSVFRPYFECPEPATRCQWDTFTTLGVCANFMNITDVVIPNCTLASWGTNCTYSFPGIVDFDPGDMTLAWTTESTGGAGPATTLFQSQFQAGHGLNNTLGTFMAVKATQHGYPNGLEPPPAEVYFNTFSWCTQTFHNITGSQTDVKAGSMSSEDLTFIAASRFGEPDNQMGVDYYSYVANSTGHAFNISKMAVLSLPNYLHTFLSATVQHNIHRPDNGPNDRLLEIGFALQNSDLKNIITAIADTLTNQIRTKDHGDNDDTSIMKGVAFFNETYIHVRWGWMALPLAEVLLTALLLVVSIIITRGQPLLRQSAIAMLTNRLEGWSDDELHVPEPQTQEKLDDLAEKMLAKLEADDAGRFRFLRK